jgi:FkbM family methyltransferase
MDRAFFKAALQSTGLFPAARTAYRKFSSSVRIQHRREVDFYASLLKPNDLCFDIGANLGQRAEVFREIGCTVVILEPNARCRDTLQFLFSRDPKVEIVMNAVGKKQGTLKLYAHGTDATGSVLPNWDRKVFGKDRGVKAQTVPVTTLDLLIERFGIPAFAKIDVEGFEAEVLSGLSTPLPLLSFEFHADDMAKTEACLGMLSRLGPISIRACSMDCEWLTPKTPILSDCLAEIKRTNAKGDLIVWGRAS